jgi:hypothetical protein
METLEQRMAQLLYKFEWTWDDREMSCPECGELQMIRHWGPNLSYFTTPGVHLEGCEMHALLTEAKAQGLLED